jgi:hypothetical protein
MNDGLRPADSTRDGQQDAEDRCAKRPISY